MAKHRKRTPAWLVGLVIAVLVFIAVLVAINALGYGDNPVLESLSSPSS
jgi:hypothetical protein